MPRLKRAKNWGKFTYKIMNPMQKILLSFLFLLIITLCLNCNSGNNNATEEKTAQKAVIDLFDGLAELDIEKVKSHCTPNIIILETGEIWNMDSTETRVTELKNKANDFKRTNKIEFLETKVSGNIAWLYYLNQATITFNGQTTSVKWLESAVLKKEDKDWKIDLLHSTELERATL